MLCLDEDRSGSGIHDCEQDLGVFIGSLLESILALSQLAFIGRHNDQVLTLLQTLVELEREHQIVRECQITTTHHFVNDTASLTGLGIKELGGNGICSRVVPLAKGC